MLLSSSILPLVTYSSNPILYVTSLLYSLLWAVAACFIAWPSLSALRRNMILARRGVLTTGHYGGSRMVAFTTPDGRKIRFCLCEQFSYYIGDELFIIYDPDNPYRAEIASVEAFWKIPLSRLVLFGQVTEVVLVLGGMFIVFAMLLTWLASTAIYFLLFLYIKRSIRLPA